MIAIASRAGLTMEQIVARSELRHLPGGKEIMNNNLYRSVEVRYGFVDNELACVWGLIPPTLLSDTAWLWLLTTDLVAEHKFLFIRHSQLWVEQALKTYPTIIGDCLISNHPAKKWLKWLGAEFISHTDDRVQFVIRARQ